MINAPIKVLLVEDSPVVLCILQRLLDQTPDIQVVGTARNGEEALAQIPQLDPQVICTDLWMDKMDGIELIEQAMARYPRPILVISQAVQQVGTVERLKEMGVVDIFPKPSSADISFQPGMELIQKIKVVSGVTVFTKPIKHTVDPRSSVPPSSTSNIEIIGIGVSTGGPQTMRTILSSLPRNFSIPILCTQHIAQGFLADHVAWLNARSKLTVSIAQEGDRPMPSHVYYAPERFHLGLTPHGRFWYDPAPPIDSHRPSVTKMFDAIASNYGARALALLLTGMGKDGAAGLLSILKAGGVTAVQDEASSVVFGMPKEAIALGAAQHIIGLDSIPTFLQDSCRHQ